jgi:hypothetical protein
MSTNDNSRPTRSFTVSVRPTPPAGTPPAVPPKPSRSVGIPPKPTPGKDDDDDEDDE